MIQAPFVVPGAPDESVLMDLLQGVAEGAYAQMPPSGPTYVSQALSGNVPLGIDTLQEWIVSLAP